MKRTLIAVGITLLAGCSTIDSVKKMWPKNHDPVMFNQLVALDIAVDRVNCAKPDWGLAGELSEQLARYAEWRDDPQAQNLRGLQKHVERVSTSSRDIFCEISKKIARERINAAKSAWEGR